MKELTTEEIRAEISKWMGRLFDKDKLPEDVRSHVEDLTKKIVASQLSGQAVTIDRLQQLFQNVEVKLKKE
jgi:dTDP-4-amino-4,6-dideoxygalactose transaminase